MGDPRKSRKQYENPRKQWDKQLLAEEDKLRKNYGLRRKRELRRLKTWLKYKRLNAKKLLALSPEQRAQRQQELVSGLSRIGIVNSTATLEDILGLKIESILERRLETIVMRKGFANSAKQSRQFITHGHIAIEGKKVTAPGYIVQTKEEPVIGWYRKPIKIESNEPKKDMKKEFEEAAGVAAEAPAEPKADDKGVEQ